MYTIRLNTKIGINLRVFFICVCVICVCLYPQDYAESLKDILKLETLIIKSEGIPFFGESFDLFREAAILFEGIVRLHIFTDGKKRTALETTRQFLNRNDHVFVVPLSGTNFIYKIARDKTLNTDKIVSEVSNWVQVHSPKVHERYKILGLLLLYLWLPVELVRFFSKIKLNRLSRWIIHRYLQNKDSEVTKFMFSIYEKQLGLFELPQKEHSEK